MVLREALASAEVKARIEAEVQCPCRARRRTTPPIWIERRLK